MEEEEDDYRPQPVFMNNQPKPQRENSQIFTPSFKDPLQTKTLADAFREKKQQVEPRRSTIENDEGPKKYAGG